MRTSRRWEVSDRAEDIAFFDLGGLMFALYPHGEMLKELGQTLDQVPGYRGSALAYNAKSQEEVDEVFRQLRDRGAEIVKPPEKVFWGGYSGYFADPDGNKWEVAYSP